MSVCLFSPTLQGGWTPCEFKWIQQLHHPTQPPFSFLRITFITGDKQVVIRGTLPLREMAWAPTRSYSALNFICQFHGFILTSCALAHSTLENAKIKVESWYFLPLPTPKFAMSWMETQIFSSARYEFKMVGRISTHLEEILNWTRIHCLVRFVIPAFVLLLQLLPQPTYILLSFEEKFNYPSSEVSSDLYRKADLTKTKFLKILSLKLIWEWSSRESGKNC